MDSGNIPFNDQSVPDYGDCLDSETADDRCVVFVPMFGPFLGGHLSPDGGRTIYIVWSRDTPLSAFLRNLLITGRLRVADGQFTSGADVHPEGSEIECAPKNPNGCVAQVGVGQKLDKKCIGQE
jgi:hypothetical protein